MHPIIPILIAGKIIAIPAIWAIKKYGASTVGRTILKSAVGSAVLSGLAYAGYKGIEFNGVFDELKKNRCFVCMNEIPIQDIVSSPIETRKGVESYIVKCPRRNCVGVNIFPKNID